MAVSLAVKALIGCAGVVGTCASASIPFMIGSSRASTTGAATTHSAGEEDSTNMISLDMCSDSQVSTSDRKVAFRTQNLTNICWLREGNSSAEDISEKEKINETLKRVWNSITWGNLGISDVADYCEQSSLPQESGGPITLLKNNADNCSGAVYLKIGSGTNTFLKRKKQDTSSQAYQVSLCTSQCWVSSTWDDESNNQPQTEQPSNFKGLQFYTKDY